MSQREDRSLVWMDFDKDECDIFGKKLRDQTFGCLIGFQKKGLVFRKKN